MEDLYEISLEEFVDAFNECDEYVCASSNDDCIELARDFERLNLKMDLKKVKPDNKELYIYLLRHCNNRNEYTFNYKVNGNKPITAKIDIFNPFCDGKVNQKWHIMISLLALLDAANNNEEFISKMSSYKDVKSGRKTIGEWLEGYRNYDIGILYLSNSGTLKLARKDGEKQSFSSTSMNKQISLIIQKNQEKKRLFHS